MAEMNLIQAVNDALRVEMRRDSRVVVLGEDVGRFGGVFRATVGLQEEFGPDRCIDTPLAESGIVGAAIGMALYGMRPVAEIQFGDYIYPAYDQIVNELAKIRYRSGGEYVAPVVIRTPIGGGIKGGHYHSQSPEALFTHVPGLKVVCPSNPYDAKGLLASAIRGEDPVIFMEPKRYYRAARGEVPEGEYTIPLGEAKSCGGDIVARVPGFIEERNFTEGQQVKKGDLLVQLDASAEEAQLASAKAGAELAAINLKRAQDLRTQNSNSQSDLDYAEAQAKQTEAAVANLESAVAKKTITAPFDGRIGIRTVNLGQYLPAGTAIVSLQSLDPIYADFSLPQQQLVDLTAGLTVHVTSDALPGQIIDGKITALGHGAGASLRIPDPLFRLHVTDGAKDGRRVIRRGAHVLHIVIEHLGHARILDELANGSGDGLSQAHAQNILEHRELEAAADIEGVAHRAHRLPKEKLVGDGVQSLRELHEGSKVRAQPRFPALERCGHLANVVFQI